jgi:hypothetical protein
MDLRNIPSRFSPLRDARNRVHLLLNSEYWLVNFWVSIVLNG